MRDLNRSRAAARRGVTVVEMVISITLGTLIAGSALQVVIDGSSASDMATTNTEAAGDLRRALDDFAREVRPADAATAFVQPSSAGAPAGRLVFETFLFVDGQPPVTIVNWIELIEEPGEPWNGADDDGDGHIDEGRLVWVRDPGLAIERRSTLCNGISRAGDGEVPGDGIDQDGDGVVDERGAELLVEGGGVLLRLATESRTDNGAIVSRAAERWIHPRN